MEGGEFVENDPNMGSKSQSHNQLLQPQLSHSHSHSVMLTAPPDESYVIECIILGVSLLLPFPLSVDVHTIATQAYAEYQALNPRAPPMKLLCVRDDAGRIMGKALRLDEHQLANAAFHIQMEEYGGADMMTTPQLLDAEYRRWQLWVVKQIYDTVRSGLVTQFTSASLEKLSASQEFLSSSGSRSRDGGNAGKQQQNLAVDAELLNLLNELSFSPSLDVKLTVIETLSLLRMQCADEEVVQAASVRIAKFIQDERQHVQVVAYGLHAYRSNAKGLMPLTSFHEKEVTMLHRLFRIDIFNDVLSRYPQTSDQRTLMLAYKAMYIHHYDVNVQENKDGSEEGRGVDRQGGGRHANKAVVLHSHVGASRAAGGTAVGPLPSFYENEFTSLNEISVGGPFQRQRQGHGEGQGEGQGQGGLGVHAPTNSMPSRAYARPEALIGKVPGLDLSNLAEGSVPGNTITDGSGNNLVSALPFSISNVGAVGAYNAGMTIARICNLLVSDERSVWAFAVNKLHVLVQATARSAEEQTMAALHSRRREIREEVAQTKRAVRTAARRSKYEALYAQNEAFAAEERAKRAAMREEDSKKRSEDRVEAEQKEKAAKEKMGKLALARLEKEKEEKKRIAALSGHPIADEESLDLNAKQAVEDELVLSRQVTARMSDIDMQQKREEEADEAMYFEDRRDDFTSTFTLSPSITEGVDYRTLFLSNAEIELLVTCLFDCLRQSIDTRSKGVFTGTAARSAFGATQNASTSSLSIVSEIGGGRGAGNQSGGSPSAKSIIDAALVSPNTDLPTVCRILDVLYRLAVPMKVNANSAGNPFRGSFDSAMQVCVAKVCLTRSRLLLTLCHAESNIIAGKSAFLLHLAVRYNALNRKENARSHDSNSAGNSTSVEDGWSGLDLRLEPMVVAEFLTAHNKSVAVNVKDSNKNKNKSDVSSYSYFGAEGPGMGGEYKPPVAQSNPSKRGVRPSGEIDEDEKNVYSKHLVNLSLDYLFSLTLLSGSDGGSGIAMLSKVGAKQQMPAAKHKLARQGSLDLEDVLSEAKLVKHQLRVADREFSDAGDDDDGFFPYVPGPLPPIDARNATPDSVYSHGHGKEKEKRHGKKEAGSQRSPSKGLKMGARAVKDSERLLEHIFLGDHYKYLLRMWHLATFNNTLEDSVHNYDCVPTKCYASNEDMLRSEAAETAIARDSLYEYILSTQQRRLAMDILSHLCALSTAFRDQLQRINAIPKLLVVVGSPGIVVSEGTDYRPYAKHNPHGNLVLPPSGSSKVLPDGSNPVPELTSESDALADGVGQGEGDGEEEEVANKGKKGAGEGPAGYRLDMGCMRGVLRLLVNLVVMQSPKKRATVVRLLQEIPIGGERFNLALRKVSQRDETCAFYFATLLSLQYSSSNDEDADADDY